MGRWREISTAFSAASLTLAGCAPPSWTDPARSHDQRELAALPVAAVAASPDPAPAPPAWAAPLVGRPLRRVFPRTDVCIGQSERVLTQFRGAPAGASVTGWGWDVGAGRPVGRVLLADSALRIVGAGDGGLPHKARRNGEIGLRAAHAGWTAQARSGPGPLRAFGVTSDGRAVCPLGQVQLG